MLREIFLIRGAQTILTDLVQLHGTKCKRILLLRSMSIVEKYAGLAGTQSVQCHMEIAFESTDGSLRKF